VANGCNPDKIASGRHAGETEISVFIGSAVFESHCVCPFYQGDTGGIQGDVTFILYGSFHDRLRLNGGGKS